jgi:hypothetical protein
LGLEEETLKYRQHPRKDETVSELLSNQKGFRPFPLFVVWNGHVQILFDQNLIFRFDDGWIERVRSDSSKAKKLR